MSDLSSEPSSEEMSFFPGTLRESPLVEILERVLSFRGLVPRRLEAGSLCL